MKINLELYIFLLIILVGSIGFLLINYDSNSTKSIVTGKATYTSQPCPPFNVPSVITSSINPCGSSCTGTPVEGVLGPCARCSGDSFSGCGASYSCKPGLVCDKRDYSSGSSGGCAIEGICRIDPSKIICTNNILEYGEVCSPASSSCTTTTGAPGTCSSDCGSCNPTPTQPVTCGNGRIDTGEECDHPDYTNADQICANNGYLGGVVAQWLNSLACINCKLSFANVCSRWYRGTLTRLSLPLPQTSVNEGAKDVVIGKYVISFSVPSGTNLQQVNRQSISHNAMSFNFKSGVNLNNVRVNYGGALISQKPSVSGGSQDFSGTYNINLNDVKYVEVIADIPQQSLAQQVSYNTVITLTQDPSFITNPTTDAQRTSTITINPAPASSLPPTQGQQPGTSTISQASISAQGVALPAQQTGSVVEIARFEVQAVNPPAGTNTISVNSINLFFTYPQIPGGTIMNGFSDIKIYYDGTLIASPPPSKSIQTVFSPTNIPSYQSKTISVKAYPLFAGAYSIELSGLGGIKPSGNPISTVTINPAPSLPPTQGQQPGTQAQQSCTNSGGVWDVFSTSCADDCSSIGQQQCPAVVTNGCNCGPTKCWNGNNCVTNPTATTTVAQLVCGGQRFYSVGSWSALNSNQLNQDVVFSIAYTSKTLEGQYFVVEFVPSQGSKLSFNGPSVFHPSTGDGWNNVPVSVDKDDPGRTHRMFTMTLSNLPVGQGIINVLNAGQSCASIPVTVIAPIVTPPPIVTQPPITQLPPQQNYMPPTVTTTGPRIPSPRQTQPKASTSQPKPSVIPTAPAPQVTQKPIVKEQKIIYDPPVFSGETTIIKIKSSEEKDKIFVKVISDLGTVKTFPAFKKSKGIFEVKITPYRRE